MEIIIVREKLPTYTLILAGSLSQYEIKLIRFIIL